MSWSTVSGDVGDDKGFSLAGGSPSLEVVLSVYSPTPFSVLSLSLMRSLGFLLMLLCLLLCLPSMMASYPSNTDGMTLGLKMAILRILDYTKFVDTL